MIMLASVILNVFAGGLIVFYLFKIFKTPIITKKLKYEDINKVYILNLDKSIDRRKYYEDVIKKYFGGKFFNKSFDDIRFQKGTDATKNLIIQDMETKEKINGIEFLQNKKELRNNILYHIFDEREPDFFFKYRPIFDVDKRILTMGEFACSLSHMRAIRDIVKNEYSHSIIFEDDFVLFKPESFYADLDKILKKTPKDYDVIKFDVFNGSLQYNLIVGGRKGSNLKENIKSYFVMGKNKYLNKQTTKQRLVVGTCYMVSYQGARKIMDFIDKKIFDGRTLVADQIFYKEAWQSGYSLNIYYAKKPLVTQQKMFYKNKFDDPTASTIAGLCVEFHNEQQLKFFNYTDALINKLKKEKNS